MYKYFQQLYREVYSSMSLPKINIITRTGTRKNCFSILKKSLETQTYKNYIHYKTNDNPENTFLKDEKNVINVTNLKETRSRKCYCPYNKYLNTVINKLTDGWVIIVDDDAKFVDNRFLEKLAKICKTKKTNEIFLYPIYFREKKLIYPINNSLKIGTFDMASICIHSSLLKQFHFTGNCGADFELIYHFLRKGYTIRIETNLPIGIWGNYTGSKKGRNIDCC